MTKGLMFWREIPIHNEMKHSSPQWSYSRIALAFVLSLGFCQVAGAQAADHQAKAKCEEALENATVVCKGMKKAADHANTQGCFTCLAQHGVEKQSACKAQCLMNGSGNFQTALAECAPELAKCKSACEKTAEYDKKCRPLEIEMSQVAEISSQMAVQSGQAAATNVAAGGKGGNGGNNGAGANGPGSATGESDIPWVPIGIVAAMGGVAALALTQGKGSSSGQQQQNNNSSNSNNGGQVTPLPTPTPGTNPILEKCGTGDYHRYTDCNTHYKEKCTLKSTDAACQAFIVRYCGSGQASLGAPIDGATADKTGEGMGTDYCVNSVAVQFCAVSGRSACPSCQNVASQESPACKGNPTLCAPQFNQAQLDAAKVTCPSDPIFSNPSYTQVGTGTTSNSGLPQVVVSTSGAKFRDIASENGPSVFSVSSGTIQGMCSQNRLNCGR